MINSLIRLSLLTMVFCSLSFCQNDKAVVRVTNPSARDRNSETITVNFTSLPPGLVKVSGSIVVRDSASGTVILSQAVDSDFDGIPESIIFQSEFKAKKSKSFFLATTGERTSNVSSLVDARFVEPRQDLAWENDRIAHRVYGPALAAESNNGIDVWTKRVRSLIIKKWYEGEEEKPPVVYHIDHGEGADFFNVGRSLGCGSTGIWSNDKVLQPGVFSSYRLIATGPLRACFELRYDKWNVGGAKFSETKRITLDAGQNLSKIEVTYKNWDNVNEIEIAGGLVKRSNTSVSQNKEHTWMSLWGIVNDDSVNGSLGTGIVFPASSVTRFTEDADQYLIIGTSKPGSTFTYYSGAGWTRSGDFTSAQDWNAYLDAFALNVRSPMLVAIQR